MIFPRESRPPDNPLGEAGSKELRASATCLRTRGANLDEARVSVQLYPTVRRQVQATPRSVEDLGVGTNEALRRLDGRNKS